MKQVYALLCVVMLIAVAFVFHRGFTEKVEVSTPTYQVDVVSVPEVRARAWGIYDAHTGERLYAENEYTPLPIASITKLMTATVAMAHLDLLSTTTVSQRAVRVEGRAGRLSAGEEIHVRELLFPLLLESSNDAAVALEEHAQALLLLEEMERTSDVLAMHDTAFGDTSGLSPENISTVDNIAQLLSHLRDTNPHILDITRLKTYLGENHMWHNNNPVVTLAGYKGGKHGYTDEAGKTLAAIFEIELINDITRDIAIILFDSEDVREDVVALQTYVREHITYR